MTTDKQQEPFISLPWLSPNSKEQITSALNAFSRQKVSAATQRYARTKNLKGATGPTQRDAAMITTLIIAQDSNPIVYDRLCLLRCFEALIEKTPHDQVNLCGEVEPSPEQQREAYKQLLEHTRKEIERAVAEIGNDPGEREFAVSQSLRLVAEPRDVHAWHRAVVRQAFKRENEDNEGTTPQLDKSTEDAFARALSELCVTVLDGYERSEAFTRDEPERGEHAELFSALDEHGEDAFIGVAPQVVAEVEKIIEAEVTEQLKALDDALSCALKSTGTHGASTAANIKPDDSYKARLDRWVRFKTSLGEPILPIVPLEIGDHIIDGDARCHPWAWVLAQALWVDVIKPQLDAEAGATSLDDIRHVVVDGCQFRKVSKISNAISWAVDVPGRAVEVHATIEFDEGVDLSDTSDLDGDDEASNDRNRQGVSWSASPAGRVIDVNGESYGPAYNEFVRIAHRTLGDVQGVNDAHRPARRTLPIDVPTLSDSKLVLSDRVKPMTTLPALSGKLLFLMLTTITPRGTRTTLGDITKALHAHTTRVQKRDVDRTARALWLVEQVRVVFPNGCGSRLFSTYRPGNLAKVTSTDSVSYFWDTAFLHAAKTYGWSTHSGEVLINLSGLSRIPVQRSAALRCFIAAQCDWNDMRAPGHVFPLPELTLDEWAIRTNSISANALHGSTQTATSTRYKVRRKMKEELTFLHDEGLIHLVVKGRGRHAKYRAEPTEAHNEAYRLYRTNGINNPH